MIPFGNLNSCEFEHPTEDAPALQSQVFPYRSFEEGTTASLSATPFDPNSLPILEITLTIPPVNCAEGA